MDGLSIMLIVIGVIVTLVTVWIKLSERRHKGEQHPENGLNTLLYT